MTGSVVKLTSERIEYPGERVQSFIALARKLDVLIPHDEWSGDLWQVGASFITKGVNTQSRLLSFYNRDATLTNRREILGGAPLSDGIKEFAKAYVRYMHSSSPVAFENNVKRLAALQFIEAAFRSLHLEPIIENLNVPVLNTAVQMAKDGAGASRHYQFALYIQQVHRFCTDRKYLNAPFQWKHGVKKPTDKTESIGREAKEWRDQKLPSPEAYRALAHVYRNSEAFIDRLYSAISAIFVSIPIRAHEVLQLRVNCEVFEKVKNPDTGEMVDVYGIRVFPGKDNPPQVKWVPTQMASVVQEAVSRIREMCAEAREVAAWYEANPGKLFLPLGLERFRSAEWLSNQDLQPLIGIASRKGVHQFLTQRGLNPPSGTAKRESRVLFKVLEEHLLSELPAEFPYFNGDRNQRYSETLILLFFNQGHLQRATNPTLIQKVTVQSYDNWLSGHDDGKQPSVFESWGFTERDGGPIKMTSHGFRHWLNTVAQLKGLSDADIAKWSGRKVEQNQAYNHVSSDEVLSQIREALDDGNGVGPMFEATKAIGVKRPVDRREFVDAQIGSALITELGICVHDYSLLPCQSHGDCLGCAENVFIKGDRKHEERVTKRLVLTEKQLEQAITAMGEDYFGADRWVEAHKTTVDKLREILAIHADPSIPDGTIVNLKGGSQDNEVAMALRDRSKVGVSDADTNDVLAEMWED